MSAEYPHLADQPRPAVVAWFKIYTGFLCLMYVAVAAASLLLLLGDPVELEMSPAEARFMGFIFLVVGVGLSVACLIPLVVGPRPWVWIYSLVVICIGLTSICTLPICIPLLLFWIKPETKRYYQQM